MFEREFALRVRISEENKKHRKLKDVLITYINEECEKRPLDQVYTRIKNSGHEDMIKVFFNQFFIEAYEKKNTIMIKGETNTGKT